MKTLTFSNISVITEDIQGSCSLSKGELISVGEVILRFFWTKLCPFFDLEFSTFSNISVITEDIYLKLRVVVHYEKGGNPPDKVMPLFRLRIF